VTDLEGCDSRYQEDNGRCRLTCAGRSRNTLPPSAILHGSATPAMKKQVDASSYTTSRDTTQPPRFRQWIGNQDDIDTALDIKIGF
jgi:hypothetical protein